MNARTPGPWTFDPATGIVSTSNATTVCYVSTIGTRADAFEVAKANGFVLAASQELLAALEQMLDYFDTDDSLLPDGDEPACMKRAREAIAKATGEPA